jgi:imidazolonepropionase-like amidohydrolase
MNIRKLLWTVVCTVLFAFHLYAQPTSIAFTNVSVIDVVAGETKPGQTVVVTGRTIAAVGPMDTVRVPSNARVIRGDGKYLIPGLWDAHVHWYDRDLLSLFIANGVTGVRIMWGFALHREWARDAEAGTLVGPRVHTAGSIIDGPRPVWPTSTSVKNDAEARQAVRDTKAMGANFAKVYSLLPRDLYLAIADEARKQGIPFVGHVPNAVSVREASDAGQRSVEHLTGIALAVSSREDELRQQLVDGGATFNRGQFDRAVYESFDQAKASALFTRFRQNGTWQSPTLVVLRNTSNLTDPSLASDPRLKYMPGSVKRQWDPKGDARVRSLTPDDIAFAKRNFARQEELVRGMNRAGVPIVAGTDTVNPYCFPGFSLHDELTLLVEAGLSPMQAVQAATINVARLVGRDKELGTIGAGKLADLVLLDADPIRSIQNTQRINMVMSNGRLWDRPALDRLLRDAESVAAVADR